MADGQVFSTASIVAAQTGQVQVGATVQVNSIDGQVSVDASINVLANGRVPILASISVAQKPGQVTVDASINAVQRADGQVAVTASINASLVGQEQIDAQIGVIFFGVVFSPASIVVLQNGQVAVVASINVKQEFGEVQIDASIAAKDAGQVFVTASVQVAVVPIFTGEVFVTASVEVDFIVDLDDRSGQLERPYIPNSGRFVLREGVLFIVDNETLRMQQLPAEGFGWFVDLISNPPGEIIVDTDKPGSYPLQYKLDRDGGRFNMGVLRIEIPDDWIKT